MSEIDCDYTDEITCPHCGHQLRNSCELNMEQCEQRVFDCEECGKAFKAYCQIAVTYTSEKIDAHSCDTNQVDVNKKQNVSVKVCEVCDGSGVVYPPCPDCEGTGMGKMPDLDCNRCDGDGFDFKHKSQCEECKGKGEIDESV